MPVIEVRQHPALSLAVVHRRADPADLARLVPECCGLVWRALQQQGVRGGRHVALYLDAEIRIMIGAEALHPFSEAGELVAATTPAGEVASTVHFGPYATLGSAHSAVLAWCRANGRRIAGPRWELYGHWEPEWNAHPERIRTDVCYLLEPLSGNDDSSTLGDLP